MKVYHVGKKSVSEFMILEQDENITKVVPLNQVIEIPTKELFTDKCDAMYELFKQRRRSGVKLSNFTKSKYFKYYCDRAKDEDPELLF